MLSSTLNKIVTDQIVNVSCQNPSLVAVSGATMRCREDGIWDRRELVCKGKKLGQLHLAILLEFCWTQVLSVFEL